MVRKNKGYADRDFQELASRINKVIIENEGLIGDQKDQVELVTSLENKFKFTMCKYARTVGIYEKFIKFIVEESQNILNARPYFREKAEIFNSSISKDIKKRDAKALMKYGINFQFINFMVKNWKGELPEKARIYYEEFLEARRILIENNLPLAINRAKLFYRKTPRSHLGLLDFIDICTYGLISGIDKYSGPYTRVWRSVCIGRMVGYMIEEYSKSFLRMYPNDKKILYRANSLKFRLKIEKVKELAKAVNESFIKDKKEGKKIPKLPITENYLRNLMNSSKYVSTDAKSGDDDEEGVSIYDYTPAPDQDTEEKIVNLDAMNKVMEASKGLDLIEMKIIRLKGVDL